MKVRLQELVLKVNAVHVSQAAENYRPPSWPPPPDWPVVIDKDGRVVSRWGDLVWDLTPWAGSPERLAFGDKDAEPISVVAQNAEILRQAIGWLIWAPRGYTNAATIKKKHSTLATIIKLCNQNRISVTMLERFPKVLEQLPQCIAPSRWRETLLVLHRLYDSRETLGFTIVDARGIRRLTEALLKTECVQTPYIPPRIWIYQSNRLRECLEDFMAHREQIESCFNFCLDAYVYNFKSIQAAVAEKEPSGGPFTGGKNRKRSRRYIGPFAETAQRFGIEDLMRRWVAGWDETRVSMFSAYFSLVTFAGQAYIANFTMQRKEEVGALRADCLFWEYDEKLGNIPVVRGETTKTDPDSDARWVSSPSVQIAVDALALIARLRMKCDACNAVMQVSPADVANPYLSSTSTEPWGFRNAKARPYDIRGKLPNIKVTLTRYPKLFDEAELRITREDLSVARRLTPNLPAAEFEVGLVWPLAWHQYRRTTAVNMAASGVVSNSSLQQQMKQLSQIMAVYYARNHSKLLLSHEVEQSIVAAMYEAMARNFERVVSDRFVSPHTASRKEAMVVQLLSSGDVHELASWASEGKVSFRENRLGGCMKIGPCEYGGIESVARCGGGDGKKACSDVLFDRNKEAKVRTQLRRVTAQMKSVGRDSPRYSALAAERKAMKGYLDVVASGS